MRVHRGKPQRCKDGEEKEENYVITEGVNLLAPGDFQDIVHPYSVYSNSIYHMLKFYGVEAARNTIIREIDGVFKGHSISVDNRHLNLIADAMTQGEIMRRSRDMVWSRIAAVSLRR